MSTKGFISYSIEKYKIILEKQSKIAIEVCTTVNDSPFYILLISNSLVNKEIIGEFNYFTQNTTFTPNDASNHLDSILVLPTKVNELGIWMALWGGIMGCVLVNMWAIFNDGYSDMDSLKNRLMIGFLSGATVGFIWVKTRR